MPANPPPPAEVELVRSFVNTLDVDEGTDALATPAGLDEWLTRVELLPAGARSGPGDLELAVRLRTALRDELVDHHDGRVDPAVQQALDEVGCALPLKAVCGPAGVAPAEGGVRGALAQVLAAAVASRIKGTWPRLKICPAEDCRWAFYDASRNRSKRWCSMEVCGNRSKVRAYRDRAHT